AVGEGQCRRLVLKSRSHLQQLGEKQVIDACAGRCVTSTGNAKPRHRHGGHISKGSHQHGVPCACAEWVAFCLAAAASLAASGSGRFGARRNKRLSLPWCLLSRLVHDDLLNRDPKTLSPTRQYETFSTGRQHRTLRFLSGLAVVRPQKTKGQQRRAASARAHGIILRDQRFRVDGLVPADHVAVEQQLHAVFFRISWCSLWLPLRSGAGLSD
ncbi:uncharacterized protein J3D65DRAFT_688333, partial [Phyllosticta citribraziliensis]